MGSQKVGHDWATNTFSFFSQKKSLDKSDVWLSRVKMKKSLFSSGHSFPIWLLHVCALWPLDLFPSSWFPLHFPAGREPSPEPLAWWDFRLLPALHARGQWFSHFGLEYTWYYGSVVLEGVAGEGLEVGSLPPRHPCRKEPSATAFSAISNSALWRHYAGGEQDLFVILGISRYILVFLREHRMWNQKTFSESWFCHWLIIKTWASHLTSGETFPTIHWQQSFNMDTSTQWLETLAPSFIKTVWLVWGIFVMDFYSAWRDNVFIAVANYRIKGSMALELRIGTPVSVRLPGFTSFIYLSAVTLDKLTSLCASPFSHL